MKNFTIKRRTFIKKEIPIYEQLMILASYQKYHPNIGDPLSLCLRICILNDLYFLKCIKCDGLIIDGNISDEFKFKSDEFKFKNDEFKFKNDEFKFKSDDLISDEFKFKYDDLILLESMSKIKNKRYTIDTAIRILNGEKGIGIKNLRKRILDQLVIKNMVSYKSTIFGLKINVKKEILVEFSENILRYLLSNNDDPKYNVLVCCLDYIGIITKLIQTEQQYRIVKNRISEILKKMYRGNDLPCLSIQNLYQ